MRSSSVRMPPFVRGDLALAREAYQKLLYAVAAYQEGCFDDGETAEPIGETHLSEAKARYLQALYETTELGERPVALLKAIMDSIARSDDPCSRL